MLRGVHGPHPALADGGQHAIARARDDLAGREIGRRAGRHGAAAPARLQPRQRDRLPGRRPRAAPGIECLRDRRQRAAIRDFVGSGRAAHELGGRRLNRRRFAAAQAPQHRAERGPDLVSVGQPVGRGRRHRPIHDPREQRRRSRSDQAGQQTSHQPYIAGRARERRRRIVGAELTARTDRRHHRAVVHQLDLAVGRDQDRSWRQTGGRRVAGRPARRRAPQRPERRRDLHRHEHSDVDRERQAPLAPLSGERGDIHSLDQLADEEQLVVEHADVIDLDEVAVDAPHDGGGLVAHGVDEIGPRPHVAFHDLERAEPLDLHRAERGEHVAARAGGNPAQQREVPERARQDVLIGRQAAHGRVGHSRRSYRSRPRPG